MRRIAAFLFLAFAYLLSAPAPASAQFGGCLPAFCGQAIPTVTCAEGTAFNTRALVVFPSLDALHQDANMALICGLVADGVWPKLDALYQLATQDQGVANLNLVSSSFTINPVASPAWVADRGYTGVEGSTTVHLDTTSTFASGNYTTNDAHVSLWCNTAGQSNGNTMGETGGAGGLVAIVPRSTLDQSQFFINTTSTPPFVASTDGRGHYIANVDSGTTLTGYKNGSAVVGPTAVTVVAPWGGPLFILAANNFPGAVIQGSLDQVSAASYGGALTSTDAAHLYARERTYMTTMGIP